MAVDMFIKIGDIEGESADSKHEKEIDVLAWSSGKVSVQDLSITKYTDAASHALIKACCDGTHYPEAKLTVRKAGKDPLEYIKLTMKEVIVSSVSHGGSGGEDRLTENVTLNFAEYKYEYTPQKADGSGGSTKEAAWHIAANKPA
jgi:type VI secretion system secreted protein Hcp